MKLTTCLLVMAITSSSVAWAQQYSIDAWRGNVLKISSYAPQASQTHIVSVNYMFGLRQAKAWKSFYKDPIVGLRFVIGDLGNRKVLGQFVALAPNINYAIKPIKGLKIATSLGIGMGYFTHKYDRISNPENVYMGAKLGFTAIADTKIQFFDGRKLSPFIAAGFQHYSNGHTDLPNTGLNIPCLMAGIVFNPLKISPAKLDTTFAQRKNKGIALYAGIGFHEHGFTLKPTNGPSFPVYELAAGYYRHSKPYFKWTAGLTWSYYTAYRDYISSQNFMEQKEFIQSSKFTIFNNFEFTTDYVALLIQPGYNIYNPFVRKFDAIDNANTPFKIKANYYMSNRVGVHLYRYKISTHKFNYYIAGYVKANFGQADFIAFGLGANL